MNYTLKLAIPLALGLAAAVVNMMVLNARTASVKFIQVNQEVDEGEPFTSDALEVLEFPGTEAGSLKDTAIRWENRSVLWERPALRDLSPGDIVLYRDFPLQGDLLQLEEGESSQPIRLGGSEYPPSILQINQHIDFLIQLDQDQEPMWVGPFRLVSVGDRVSNSTFRSRASGSANTITVAVKSNLANKPELTPDEKAQLERQNLLDKFAEKEQQNVARLLNVRISPQLNKPGP